LAEQQPGLRFDIYERVHVHEGDSAISELNEVELVPHIQVLTHEEQAILKGNLLLTGKYVGDTGEDVRTLEHLIPVEITLPLNRIHRVEDILVEIENFDVDLLTPRSLNVTGVLSLQGVEVISAATETWREQVEEEEVVFVHETEEAREEHLHGSKPLVPEQDSVAAFLPPTVLPIEEQIVTVTNVPIIMEEETYEVQASSEDGDVTVLTEEKKDLKVAFGKKADEAVEVNVNPYGIKSLLTKASSLFHTEKRKEEENAAAQSLLEESKADNVEWQRLFQRSEGETKEFRKLRMCIVQKEETLETIAKRYQFNARELQLYNRLSDQEISAGQILYLPR
jgi:stage VI sporulation protein D